MAVVMVVERLRQVIAVSGLLGLALWAGACRTGSPEALPAEAVHAIRGVVFGQPQENPEPGVWVIAETRSLATPFRRIVVTDENGRFVIPDLPEGEYTLWVRGYGLTDSTPVPAARGDDVRLDVTPAADPQTASRVYPASYWLSLFEPPVDEDEALPDHFATRSEWIVGMKLGCMRCHQFGGQVFHQHTSAASWHDAWQHRSLEQRTAEWLGGDHFAASLSDWASRIAAGAVPPTPPRPSGIERNIVISQWDWGRADSYIHDVISTDKRDPTLYPFGRVYGVDFGQDLLWALDPSTHAVTSYAIPTANVRPVRPAPFPGAVVYHNPANPHVPTMDDRGRVWMAVQVRPEGPEDQPSWVDQVRLNVMPDASEAQVAAVWASGTHHRQLGYFQIDTEEMVLIDTAYGTNHLQLDQAGRLWTSGDSVGLGMLDTHRFDPTRVEESQVEAQRVFVSVRDNGTSLAGGGYGITVNPADGTVWRTNTYIGNTGSPDNSPFVGQNAIIGFDPETRTFSSFTLPPPGRAPVGIDATTDGRLWFGTASGHLGSFDPSTETFRYWRSPGPAFTGVETASGSADFHYNIFVDQFGALGLGPDLVILTGANADALVLFDPEREEFMTIRVPFPLTMYHRGLDGRIDDPEGGWRGRGLWLNYGNDPVKYVETARGAVVHIQVRPHPLAF